MKCKHCNAEIYGKADFCPLCKQPLTEQPNEHNKEYIYPLKKKRDKQYKWLAFSPIYLSISLTIFLVLILVNLLVVPEVQWCWLVGIALLYVYILVQNTILSRNSVASKILWQALLIFAFLWALGFILYQSNVIEKVWEIIIDLALPIVIGVSNLVMCIITACLVNKDKSLIVDTIWFSITGFLPIILYGAGVLHFLYLAIAILVLSVIQIIVLSIAGRKYVKNESTYKFRA